jgi:hypothetical protein
MVDVWGDTGDVGGGRDTGDAGGVGNGCCCCWRGCVVGVAAGAGGECEAEAAVRWCRSFSFFIAFDMVVVVVMKGAKKLFLREAGVIALFADVRYNFLVTGSSCREGFILL